MQYFEHGPRAGRPRTAVRYYLGLLLAAVWAGGGGLWAGFWLVGLPAWILLCQRLSGYPGRKRAAALLGFAGLYAGASLIFVLSLYIPNPAALLLPLLPAARLYFGSPPAGRKIQSLFDLVLSTALVVLVQAQPEYDWGTAWSYAGAAVTGVLILALHAGRKPEGLDAD